MFLWNIAVTSLVEVWIEIVYSSLGGGKKNVTSLVEVWIEMVIDTDLELGDMSLPLWKCGLKS